MLASPGTRNLQRRNAKLAELAKVRAELDHARVDARQAGEAAAELRGKATAAPQPSPGKGTTAPRKGTGNPSAG